MNIYWVIFIGLMVLSLIISKSLSSAFNSYSNIPTEGYLTGKQVAEQMLRDNDIYDVTITCIQGQLTDHYNPIKKTLNLSQAVYNGNSVAAAAVAAHECGHAVQHAQGYAWLQLRSNMVPAVNFASKWVQWILLAGIIALSIGSHSATLLWVGIVLFALTTLFSFVTLPVEINASARALAWIENHQITNPQSHQKAKRALRLAAYTYVVAALSSLATLLYYVSIAMGRSRD
ncbi:MAG: zinc metallopeptidase [Bacteroidales bacterium]|nr:zinc metallopeptidase [Candidatus Scybalousia scybalohippi]MCQ2327242.1 zinc metallopeptidase [Bacteroidales bacterium]